MHPWLLFGAVVLAKKAIAGSIYVAGKKYGWPRVYRRLLEYNRKVTPAANQKAVRSAVAAGFRLPGEAFKILQREEVQKFLAVIGDSKFAQSYSVFPGVTLSKVVSAARVLPKGVVDKVASEVAEKSAADHRRGHDGNSSSHGAGGGERPLR